MNNFITGGESFSLTLNSPITKSQWEEITDVNMEHSDRVVFITPKGKKVEYVKEKHGKWEKISDRNYKCSCCNAWWSVDRDSTMKDYNYCPHCGAKMDGGEDDPEG